MHTQNRGRWSSFDFTLTPEAKHVFEIATRRLSGSHYTAFAFASRVLVGTQYAFLCEALSSAEIPRSRVVKIRILQPLDSNDTPFEAIPIIESTETIAP